ncbi:hypothetical protein [Methanoregula sp. UBA64]|jgi:hypothetical protein|uniref:hypothetical protein n=1 Tax=Methanoregula sp. UBA64 TaxID=1915554 RepID=UPI0025F2BAD3|nr:hypothetical protein [Methanoregula sp. UBA64]
MIDLLMDILITLLLLAAIGFAGISLIGLLIFPDIRSRSFTGIRAGIISLSLVAAAGVCYGLYTWVVTGGMQYLLFVVAAVLAVLIIVVLTRKAAETSEGSAGCPGNAPQEQSKKE